jgi:peptidyl-prolyl cis-trans isomerase A (cyclophilin A)
MNRAMTLTLAFIAIAAISACGDSGGPPPELLNPDSTALSAAAPDSFDVVFETSKGAFTVRARRDWAPHGVDRFHFLVSNRFYDDARFFRVIPGFVAQFGMSGYPQVTSVWTDMNIRADSVRQGNARGRITYAMGSSPDSRTTQLFINLVDNPRLDGMGFAAFGEVIEGMNVVDSLYGGYGNPPDTQQSLITAEGNAFLARDYPMLDHITTARVVRP